MSRHLKQATVVVFVVFGAAQLIRPKRANPVIDPSHTIQAQVGTSSELVAILDRACRDCHSNQTIWPWYTRIAPVSWLMVYGVNEGRKSVNFSEWGAYSLEKQRQLLAASCKDVSSGKMPGAYTWVRPETRLSVADIGTICAARQEAEADTGVKR